MTSVAPHPFTSHLLDYYARTAGSYESWDGAVHARAAHRCVEVAEPRPGMAALDLGCGTGLVTRSLAAETGELVVGVDLSPAMLAIAGSQRTRHTTFLPMDAERLQFEAASFDLVTMCQVLSYQLAPERVLAEARRVLRPGGRVMVCCQQRSLATPADRIFFRGLDSLAASGFRIPRPPDHNALFGEPWAIRRFLEDTGFVDVRTTNLLVGNHTANAAAWIDLTRGAGPYPEALISVLGPAMRAQLETALELTMRGDEDGFRYHRAFTFAVAGRG